MSEEIVEGRVELDVTDYVEGMDTAINRTNEYGRTNENVNRNVRQEQTRTAETTRRLTDDIKDLFQAFMSGEIIRKVAGFMRSASEEAEQSRKNIAGLNQVLKTTGNYSDEYSNALQNQASELENLTGIEGDEIMMAQRLLLTFTNISRETMPDATKAVLDVSAAMGGDAKGAALQLGKALNDPIEGISALTRVGVSFNDQQKETIKKLVESNQMFKAQKVILDELQKEFGGQAEVMKDYASDLKLTWKNLLQSYGEDSKEFFELIVSSSKKALDLLTLVISPSKRDEAAEKQAWENIYNGRKKAKERLNEIDREISERNEKDIKNYTTRELNLEEDRKNALKEFEKYDQAIKKKELEDLKSKDADIIEQNKLFNKKQKEEMEKRKKEEIEIARKFAVEGGFSSETYGTINPKVEENLYNKLEELKKKKNDELSKIDAKNYIDSSEAANKYYQDIEKAKTDSDIKIANLEYQTAVKLADITAEYAQKKIGINDELLLADITAAENTEKSKVQFALDSAKQIIDSDKEKAKKRKEINIQERKELNEQDEARRKSNEELLEKEMKASADMADKRDKQAKAYIAKEKRDNLSLIASNENLKNSKENSLKDVYNLQTKMLEETLMGEWKGLSEYGKIITQQIQMEYAATAAKAGIGSLWHFALGLGDLAAAMMGNTNAAAAATTEFETAGQMAAIAATAGSTSFVTGAAGRGMGGGGSTQSTSENVINANSQTKALKDSLQEEKRVYISEADYLKSVRNGVSPALQKVWENGGSVYIKKG